MVYSLTQELEDLLAVTYVMNSLLYILEQEDGTPQESHLYQGASTNQGISNLNVAGIKIAEKKEQDAELSTSIASVESLMPQDPRQRMTISGEALGIPRESRSPSAGATRLLMRLEEENESLSEQVEVLEKMNERLIKKVKDLEVKLSAQKNENDMETAEKVKQIEEELEKTRKEDDMKNRKIVELVNRIEEAENELQLKAADHSEMTKKLEEREKELERNKQKMEIMENEIRAVIEDIPKVDHLSVVKSYLHPEMARHAEEIVKDAFGPRNLFGDDAARFVSNSFDKLYGPHWQAVLFRTDGHGCFVYHNNNCYIRFELGNYQFVLFRY